VPEALVSSAPMPDLTNVFVSHLHEDDSRIDDLKNLGSDRGLTIRDSSINATRPNNAKDPDYIKNRILAPRIDWAGTMVVLISAETKNSEYVAWEIEYAQRTDTRIVGVFTSGAAGSDMPEGLEDYADAIVNWNGDAIVEAIRGKDEFRDPEGVPRAKRDIARYGC
jgi:MTH538 TIR-like domain (DUF1863)